MTSRRKSNPAWRQACAIVKDASLAERGQPQLEDSLTLRKQVAREFRLTEPDPWRDPDLWKELRAVLLMALTGRPGELTEQDAVRRVWAAGRRFRRHEDAAHGGIRTETKLETPIMRPDGTLAHRKEETVWFTTVELDALGDDDRAGDDPALPHERLVYGDAPEGYGDPAIILELQQEQARLAKTLDALIATLTPRQQIAVATWRGGNEDEGAQARSDRAAMRASGLSRREADALRQQLRRALGSLDRLLAGVDPAATDRIAPARYGDAAPGGVDGPGDWDESQEAA